MEEPYQPYAYRPLSSSTDEIRLFEIDSASSDDEISGRLIHVSLQDNLDFTALSYMWGSPSCYVSIQICNDSYLRVSPRLHVALRDLRHLQVQRVWIDAICINQGDALERNHQVSLMASIYSRAIRVLIWIDEVISVQDPGLLAIRDLEADSSVEDLARDEASWESINKVVANGYWSRIWAQQEISSASLLSLFCHRTEIPLKPLLHFDRIRVEMLWREGTRDGIGNLFSDWALNDAFSRASVSLPKDDLVGLHIREVSNPLFGTHRYFLIFDAIQQSRKLDATDPKDKIFAFIPFIRSWKTPFAVDYTLSVRQVYTMVAKYMVDEWKSLDFLCDCIPQDSKSEYDLPSWLPDYGTKPSIDSFPVSKMRTAVDFQYLQKPLFLSDDRELQVQGFRVGEVLIPYRHLTFQEILHDLPARQMSKAFHDIILTSLQLMETAGVLDYPPVMPPEFHLLSRQSVLFKVLVGTEISKPNDEENDKHFRGFLALMDTVLDTSPLTNNKSPLSYAELLWHASNLSPTELGDSGSIDWSIFSRLQGRVIYLSNNGNMGLAPIATRPRDEIWVIFGCKWPMILRPEGEHYCLIGAANHECVDIREEILDNLGIESPSCIKNGTRWENKQGKFMVETISLH